MQTMCMHCSLQLEAILLYLLLTDYSQLTSYTYTSLELSFCFSA